MTRCPCCGGRHLPLMDRVRAALGMEPEANLGRLMWITGDRRPEMVATLARMVRLRRERGTVQAPEQIQREPRLGRATCGIQAANRNSSLQASRSDNGSR